MLRILRPRRRLAFGPAAWTRQLSAACGTPLAAACPLELPRPAHRPRPLSASPAPDSRQRALSFLGRRQYSEATAAEPLSENAPAAAMLELSVAERPLPSTATTTTTTDAPLDGQELPFIEAILRQTPDRHAAQLRLEDWAGDMFRLLEETRQTRREARGQLNPQVLAHLARSEDFSVFVWEWVERLTECFETEGLKGLAKPTQKFLNEEYLDHQIFSNEDLAHILVGTLMEELVQVVSVPESCSEPPAADESGAGATAAENSGVSTLLPHDIKLIKVALALGNALLLERNIRILGIDSRHASELEATDSVSNKSPKPSKSEESPNDSKTEESPRNSVDSMSVELENLGMALQLSPSDLVRIGGDLLFYTQQFELNVPGAPAPVRPWTKILAYDTQTNRTRAKRGEKMIAKTSQARPAFVRFDQHLLALSLVVNKNKLGHRDVPMLVPPVPVTRTESGPYYSLQRNFLNAKPSHARTQAIDDARMAGEMDHMIEALNFLSDTPWRTADLILDDLARAWPDTDVDPRDPIVREAAGWMPLPPGLKLQSQDKPTVDLARAFRGQFFYNAVRPDYRGRIYPACTDLSTVSNDLTRSLLLFDKAKPLGVVGWRELRLHLASLHGSTKKLSFDERLKWVDDNWDDIVDSGVNGLDGRMWYTTGDSPWQVRATCAEIARAAAHPGGPELFESRLPVHQDGSCNGLQHYAALARDVEGGAAVNLLPSERPADVYSQVLERVVAKIEQEAAAGATQAQKLLEKREQVFVRDLVKRTVMTRVYGLTAEGARRHAEEFLAKINFFGDKGAPPINDSLDKYLSDVVVDSIAGLFPRATAIQQWLHVCASLILRSSGVDEAGNPIGEGDITMSWTSPLGFPVVQDIRKYTTEGVRTRSGRISVQNPDDREEVITRKELDAFAPNFIHSLDAAHLYRTALNCQTHGITMGSVHDSFWTHAGDIDVLRQITRLTFVAQYEVDVLAGFRSELIHRYGDNTADETKLKRMKKEHRKVYEIPNKMLPGPTKPLDAWGSWGSVPVTKKDLSIRTVLPPCPSSGTLVLPQVIESDYFFH